MFQLTACHNEDESCMSIEEYLEILEDHHLNVVHQKFDPDSGDTTIVIQGTKANFFKWCDNTNDGPAWNEEEFMDLLVKVKPTKAA
jgi:hypothetical protein